MADLDELIRIVQPEVLEYQPEQHPAQRWYATAQGVKAWTTSPEGSLLLLIEMLLDRSPDRGEVRRAALSSVPEEGQEGEGNGGTQAGTTPLGG